MRYPLLVFDWDGTLIDSAPTIVACIQAACRDLGLTVPDEARASHVIGLGLKDALSYAIPGLPVADYGKVVDSYRRHFLARDPEIPLFPGARSMLAGLRDRGHILAIATGKSRAGLTRALDNTALRRHSARSSDGGTRRGAGGRGESRGAPQGRLGRARSPCLPGKYR